MKLVVNAGPGTGKTTTACRLIKYLRARDKEVFLKNTPHTEEQLAVWQYVENEWAAKQEWYKSKIMPTGVRILYAAYNKDAVEDVKSRLPESVEARTIHGAGYQVLNTASGYIRLNESRGISIVESITGQNSKQNREFFKWLASLKFLEKLKDELLGPTEENLKLMQAKYDSLLNFPIHSQMIEHIKQLVPKMKVLDRNVGIEYIDQVWMAIWQCNHPPFDLAIIDECQDLSPSRLALAKKLGKNLVFIGDEDQAINAFSGADPHAFERIRKDCDAELPLKTVFRCPANVIQMANMISPRAKLRGVKEHNGEVKQVMFENLPEVIKSRCHFPNKPDEYEPNFLQQHLILCRYNAPLVRCGLNLFRAGIPAVISGKKLVSSLTYIIDKLKATNIRDLQDKLDLYEQKLTDKANENLKEMVTDKIDCIRYAIEECDHIDELKPTLTRLFTPKKDDRPVTLSTIHKAKGKENEHVYILFPPIPSPRATTVDQKQQEKNLEFVAVTRTLNTLTWVVKE
jgi:DNA helicase-2/ATP-dependent DNA helicase PcrA